MTYVSPLGVRGRHLPSGIAAPENKVLRIIDIFIRPTPTRELYVAFKIPYVYASVTWLCMQEAHIRNHENACMHYIVRGKAAHKMYKT